MVPRVGIEPTGTRCLFAIRAHPPKSAETQAFSRDPPTLGEHIKRCRYLRKLTQKQVAKLLGVSPFTVLNWEKDKTVPPGQFMPVILRFLGYAISYTPEDGLVYEGSGPYVWRG